MHRDDKIILGTLGGLALAAAGVRYYLVHRAPSIPAGSGSQQTPSTGVPGQVASVRVQVTGPFSATLSWPPVQGSTCYTVQHTDASANPVSMPLIMNGQTTPTLQVSGTSINIGANYRKGASVAHLTVSACNANGNGVPSPVVAINFPG